MYEVIESEEDGGSISGYTVSVNEENYKNFLEENIADDIKRKHIIGFIEAKGYQTITVIKNLNVDREYRGQGIGKGLLEDAIASSQFAMLISDKHESQVRSFVLNKFYENAGFEKIVNTSGGYFMTYPSETATELKEYVKSQEAIEKKNIKKMKI